MKRENTYIDGLGEVQHKFNIGDTIKMPSGAIAKIIGFGDGDKYRIEYVDGQYRKHITLIDFYRLDKKAEKIDTTLQPIPVHNYDNLIQQYWFSSTKEEYMPLYPDFGNGILKGKELEQKKKYFDTLEHNSFPLN